MNGDSRETGKLTPDGKPDPSVFSTKHNREGIRVGTAIGLLVRVGAGLAPPEKGAASGAPTVSFRDFWGVSKNSDLLESLKRADSAAAYQPAQPDKSNRYSFRPSVTASDYMRWPRPPDLCQQPPISGLQEMRKGALMDLDRESLGRRLAQYLDPAREFVDLEASGLKADGGRFHARQARERILQTRRRMVKEGKPDRDTIVRYALYPFDSRWAYHSNIRPLWNEPRPALAAQGWSGNSFFVVRMFAERPNEHAPVVMTRSLPDYHLLRPNAVAIPVRLSHSPSLAKDQAPPLLAATEGPPAKEPEANLSSPARAYLAKLGIENPDADSETAGLIWMHALAIGYSPVYLTENADGIRQDWPRIPLPDSRELLLASSALGRQIAALLDTEAPFDTAVAASLSHQTQDGGVKPPLQKIAVPARVDSKTLDEAKDLVVTAGWGHPGKEGVTMPGKGRLLERDYTPEELEAATAMAVAAQAVAAISDRRTSDGERSSPLQLLGDRTCDIYLNDVAYWKNIPLRVWEYTIGGYQVIKKWLSYRERKLLGRSLNKDEVRYVSEMARRIAAILSLEPALDANYVRVKQSTYAWK
jgi:Type ISP C-terminal specificity domain